jgi:hypothetical protein
MEFEFKENIESAETDNPGKDKGAGIANAIAWFCLSAGIIAATILLASKKGRQLFLGAIQNLSDNILRKPAESDEE